MAGEVGGTGSGSDLPYLGGAGTQTSRVHKRSALSGGVAGTGPGGVNQLAPMVADATCPAPVKPAPAKIVSFKAPTKMPAIPPAYANLSKADQQAILAYAQNHPDRAAFSILQDAARAREILDHVPELSRDERAKLEKALLAGEAPLARARGEQRFEDWLAKNPGRRAEEIIAELKALSKEHPLSEDDKVYLIARALPPGRFGLAAAEQLAAVPEFRGAVAEWLLHRAAEVESKSETEGRDRFDSPHHQARAYVITALKAMDGHDEELGRLIAQEMTPEEGARIGRAMDWEDYPQFMAAQRDQVLSALNSVPRTETTGAVVRELYLQMQPGHIRRPQQLAVNLAKALGREFYPHLPRTAASERDRLYAILKDPRGAALMLSGSQEWRQLVLKALQHNPNITVKTFEHDCAGSWMYSSTLGLALAKEILPANMPDRDVQVEHIGKTSPRRKVITCVLGNMGPVRRSAPWRGLRHGRLCLTIRRSPPRCYNRRKMFGKTPC